MSRSHVAAVAALWGAALGTALAVPVAARAELPQPAGIDDQVRFWTRTYAEVDSQGGLIHDDLHMGVVYEIVRFPLSASSRQRERKIEAVKNEYRAILRKLGRGVRSGLSAKERRVLALWPEGVSNATLRSAAYRVRYQMGQADKFREGLIRAGAWLDHIEEVLAEYDVPPELSALPHVESSFNPQAYSRVGAAGLWQFTRSTGRMYLRVDHIVDERLDPHKSTVAAARLLRDNYRRLRTWPLAITAYNHGAGGMARAVRQLGTRDIDTIIERYKGRTFGFASRNFYTSLLAAVHVDRNADVYFGPLHRNPPTNYEVVKLDQYYPVDVLSRALGIPTATLREHNLALRPSVWNGAKYVPRDYELNVPRDHLSRPAKVALASIPASQRVSEQKIDRFHRVQRGETLSRIASRYRVSQHELVAVNNLRSRHHIRAGQVLRLPVDASGSRVTRVARQEPPASGLYTVSRGDTLWRIARRFGVSETELVHVHRLRNRHRIHPGQRLRIPGAGPSAEPTVVASASEPSGDADDAEATSEAGAAAEATSPPEPEKTALYVVRRGDTLSEIGRRFGVSQHRIAAHNGLRSRNRIYPGQRLRIPGSSVVLASVEPSVTHVVRRGDTLWEIARRYGVSQWQIASYNDLDSRHRILPGQRLHIPGASGAVATKAPSHYVVRRGDTLWEIARRYDVSEHQIAAENGLRSRHRIQPGQKLRIPGVEPVTVASVSDEVEQAAEEPEPAPQAAPALAPSPAPFPAPQRSDPSNYDVGSDDRIVVQAEETLGHYAEWLELSASRLRRLNGMRYGTPVQIGQRLRLDFSRVTPAIFEQRRLGYHQALQEEFFDHYAVTGTEEHVLRRGETLWFLAHRKFRVPVWLLRQYNPELDFAALHPGTRMTVPRVEPTS